VAKKYMVMPIHRIRNFLTLAMVDPTDLEIIEDVRFRTGLSIQPVIASETGVINAINKYYGTADAIRSRRSSRTSPWPTTAVSTSSRRNRSPAS